MSEEKGFCRKCGTKIKEDDVFCSKCGTALSASVESNQTAENSKKSSFGKKIILIIFGISALFLLVGVLNGMFHPSQISTAESINSVSTTPSSTFEQDAELKAAESDIMNSTDSETSSTAQVTQTNQIGTDDERWVNYIKSYSPILTHDSLDLMSAVLGPFRSACEAPCQKLEDDTNSAIKDDIYYNLSPYYKDTNSEWIAGLQDFKTGIGFVRNVIEKKDSAGDNIGKGETNESFDVLYSGYTHISNVNASIKGLT